MLIGSDHNRRLRKALSHIRSLGGLPIHSTKGRTRTPLRRRSGKVARRSFLIPSQLRPPLLLRSQGPRAPQTSRAGSPRPMVPHMAWGRRSRIHLRSMSLARLRQPPLPSDGHYPCLSAWPRSSPGQRDRLHARPTLLSHHLLDELPPLPQTTCVCTRRTRQGAHEPQGAASLDQL